MRLYKVYPKVPDSVAVKASEMHPLWRGPIAAHRATGPSHRSVTHLQAALACQSRDKRRIKMKTLLEQEICHIKRKRIMKCLYSEIFHTFARHQRAYRQFFDFAANSAEEAPELHAQDRGRQMLTVLKMIAL